MLVEKYTILGKDYLKEQNKDGLSSHVCNHLLRTETHQKGLEMPGVLLFTESDKMG